MNAIINVTILIENFHLIAMYFLPPKYTVNFITYLTMKYRMCHKYIILNRRGDMYTRKLSIADGGDTFSKFSVADGGDTCSKFSVADWVMHKVSSTMPSDILVLFVYVLLPFLGNASKLKI